MTARSDTRQPELDLFPATARPDRPGVGRSLSHHGRGDDTPAQRLRGVVLDTGWTIKDQIPRHRAATGANFSVPYVVSRNGRKAFLKAMDYAAALRGQDPATTLQSMTEAYVIERDLLIRCKHRQLSRIVRMLDYGTHRVGSQPAEVVQYIIFEMADGDIRTMISSSDRFDLAWSLRTMHQCTAALRQLHSIDIAHQDIKPSNLLTFDNSVVKVADLGSASHAQTVPDEIGFAGDKTYAPPEILYGDVADASWHSRRLTDMYMLGSIIMYLFSGAAMTPSLFDRMSSNYWPGNWRGSYLDVLPYVTHAFSAILNDIRERSESCASDLATIIQQLCDPNRERRGHPKDRKRHQCSLERYVSKLNLLATRAEWSFSTGTGV